MKKQMFDDYYIIHTTTNREENKRIVVVFQSGKKAPEAAAVYQNGLVTTLIDSELISINVNLSGVVVREKPCQTSTHGAGEIKKFVGRVPKIRDLKPFNKASKLTKKACN